MKIHPVTAEFFHAYEMETDMTKLNNHFFPILQTRLKISHILITCYKQSEWKFALKTTSDF